MPTPGSTEAPKHRPVMVRQIVEAIDPCDGKVILDLTVGQGGHSRAFLERGARVVGLDRDPEALRSAARVLAQYGERLTLIHGRMSQARELLRDAGIEQVQGCLIDLGISMDQQLDEARGFTVHSELSLDLRMDPTDPGSLTGERLVNEYLDSDLHRVFAPVERKREARAVVRAILRERKRHRIETAAQFADIVVGAMTRSGPRRRIDAAPYVMCLRAEVNAEFQELEAGVEAGVSLLSADGHAALCILSWHGQEHHNTRCALRRLQHPCTCPPDLPLCACGKKPLVRIITPKPLSPDEEEVASNPAARSARLSVAVRLAAEDLAQGTGNDTAPMGRGPQRQYPERQRRR